MGEVETLNAWPVQRRARILPVRALARANGTASRGGRIAEAIGNGVSDVFRITGSR